ncbi:PaaI family thioesterase [Azohydromonas caseinilytica]|uniref:Medium/long-chain acyl-CoA thioesterase YigI n=1 Tax=Azohydromonas caseinilytica TaxID=2728836 RepID=A0A848F9D0_9BURK|nr:PaaI family thioesterase [Azohydromonas caseinilytica]NML15325.1 PaaI family thioesterase [Azohydromonas caseinilytica]
MSFVPADAGYAQRVRESFARQGAMRTLGATLEAVSPGHVVVVLRHKPELSQQHDFMHAGMLTAALDSACGYAAFSLMPADASVLSVEFKVNLLAPAQGPWLRCDARVLKAGRTISVVEARALQHESGGPEKLVATMTATMMTVQGRPDVRG